MNKNLKKVIAPVAAAAMVLAVPTGVYAEDGAQEKHGILQSSLLCWKML